MSVAPWKSESPNRTTWSYDAWFQIKFFSVSDHRMQIRSSCVRELTAMVGVFECLVVSCRASINSTVPRNSIEGAPMVDVGGDELNERRSPNHNSHNDGERWKCGNSSTGQWVSTMFALRACILLPIQSSVLRAAEAACGPPICKPRWLLWVPTRNTYMHGCGPLYGSTFED